MSKRTLHILDISNQNTNTHETNITHTETKENISRKPRNHKQENIRNESITTWKIKRTQHGETKGTKGTTMNK